MHILSVLTYGGATLNGQLVVRCATTLKLLRSLSILWQQRTWNRPDLFAARDRFDTRKPTAAALGAAGSALTPPTPVGLVLGTSVRRPRLGGPGMDVAHGVTKPLWRG